VPAAPVGPFLSVERLPSRSGSGERDKGRQRAAGDRNERKRIGRATHTPIQRLPPLTRNDARWPSRHRRTCIVRGAPTARNGGLSFGAHPAAGASGRRDATVPRDRLGHDPIAPRHRPAATRGGGVRRQRDRSAPDEDTPRVGALLSERAAGGDVLTLMRWRPLQGARKRRIARCAPSTCKGPVGHRMPHDFDRTQAAGGGSASSATSRCSRRRTGRVTGRWDPRANPISLAPPSASRLSVIGVRDSGGLTRGTASAAARPFRSGCGPLPRLSSQRSPPQRSGLARFDRRRCAAPPADAPCAFFRYSIRSWPYESAFALIVSNSSWVIVPASSSSLALAISAADPPAASRTYWSNDCF
jgi:hypothetical protein